MLYQANLLLSIDFYSLGIVGIITLFSPSNTPSQAACTYEFSCSIDSDLDAILNFFDSQVISATVLSAMNTKTNVEYALSRDINNSSELTTLIQLLGAINVNSII